MSDIHVSPSGASRFLACPGSVRLCKEAPKIDRQYSLEGTAAHALAEQCLSLGKNASDYLNDPLWIKETHCEKVTQNMVDAVDEYLEYVRSLPGSTELVEEELDLSFIDDAFKHGGTVDYAKYDEKLKELYIVDYKHGVGTLVSPENNPQLKLYALAVAKKIHQKFDGEKKKVDPKTIITKIKLVIVQPRSFEAESIKVWETSFKHIFDWCFQVVRESISKIKAGDNTLRLGEHCKYCDAKPICPQQAKTAKEVAKVKFDSEPNLEPPESIPVDRLQKILPYTKYIKDWLKSIEEYALSAAKEGTKFEGMKLVRGRSTRKWINADDAENALTDFIGGGAYAERKILSVAQAEKALKKAGESPEAILADLWEKTSGALKLVGVNEPGKEVEVANDADSFDDLTKQITLDPSFWD